MFKDCKTGGYNLESTHANGQQLMALILIIAIAYSWAILAGRKTRRIGLQKYVGRLQVLKQIHCCNSAFWIGMQWLFMGGAMEEWAFLATQLIQLKPNKLPYFQKALRAMTLIQSIL